MTLFVQHFTLLLLSCALLFGISKGAKTFKHCNSPHGTIQAVSVSSCSERSAFCPFKKSTNVSISLDFTPSYAAKSVQVKIQGEVGGVPVPFGVSPSEACGNYGLSCPLAVGKMSKFALQLPIKMIYPAIPVVVTINLMDESKKSVACVKFNAKIIN